jgi:hypothetical protein
MKFKLKEDVVTVRDETIHIRELTHAERLQWVKHATEDRFRGPALLISLGVTDPAVTEDDAGTWPADVVTTVSDAIMKISNMNAKKENPAEKQP